MTPVFIMLVGLPASGKTTYADKMKEQGYCSFSSDDIRIELFGDVSDVSHNSIVFDTLHSRLIDSLKKGKNCIFDATNISKQGRIKFLESIKEIKCTKKCVAFDVPVQVCMERNKKRDRQVPESVFEKMQTYFSLPSSDEGWDEIETIR